MSQQRGGLLQALLDEYTQHKRDNGITGGAAVQIQPPETAHMAQAQMAAQAAAQAVQTGGADSYAKHRGPSRNDPNMALARANLLNTKQHPWEQQAATGEQKRAAWIAEVRDVMVQQGINWRDALKEASRRRKENIEGYATYKERVTASYTGRNAATVDCPPGKACPGKYTKPVARDQTGEIVYRPNAHNVSRAHLTTEAATHLLRDYYRQRANKYKNGLPGATKAMRQDISRLNKTRITQSPCPTKKITVTRRKDGLVYQRNVVDKSHPDYAECRSNWLYRDNPGKFDMQTVDAGEGKDSPAYGKTRLYKTKGRSPRTKKPSRRLGAGGGTP
jgi:hypothetical protein